MIELVCWSLVYQMKIIIVEQRNETVEYISKIQSILQRWIINFISSKRWSQLKSIDAFDSRSRE